jgi:hypothetical protein
MHETSGYRLAKMVRFGARQARYFGRTASFLQALMAAAVANLTLIAGKTGETPTTPEYISNSPIDHDRSAYAHVLPASSDLRQRLPPRQPVPRQLLHRESHNPAQYGASFVTVPQPFAVSPR